MREYIKIFLPFLKEIDKLAMDKQATIERNAKYDGTVVTEVDLQISQMFHDLIDKNFTGHYIIDEERAIKDKETRKDIDKYEYVWIIDPIDGTKTYSLNSNLFSTAISLFKNKKPIFGLIYVPAFKEIICNYNDTVYRGKDLFTEDRKIYKTEFIDRGINKNSFLVVSAKELAERIKPDAIGKLSYIDPYSTYLYYYYVFNNSCIATLVKHNVSMWDIYSGLPIAKAMGMEFYNINNGETLEELDFNLFEDNLKVKNVWLVCHKSYKDALFDMLKSDKDSLVAEQVPGIAPTSALLNHSADSNSASTHKSKSAKNRRKKKNKK
jgi:fructose-1,6-bisphosphatase/inositol monophosphatase family enzyme